MKPDHPTGGTEIICPLSAEQEREALARAYVPEHIPSLMRAISKGQPFLAGEYLGLQGENWATLVGYPLGGDFRVEECEGALRQVLSSFQPEHLFYIGAEIPPMLHESCRELETDFYYRLEVAQFKPKSGLRRAAAKAAQDAVVEVGREFRREHNGLVRELLRRQKLPPLVAELYRSTGEILKRSPGACLLEARDKKGRLCAFYLIERAAPAFDAYVLGCHSKKRYLAHASDLLFWEMVKLAREGGKATINLGLGVNDGIRRFKEKWGGVRWLSYAYCACDFRAKQSPLALVDRLLQEGL